MSLILFTSGWCCTDSVLELHARLLEGVDYMLN